tara:strand:- start:1011 stop:1691 length:681 start_codon:yes stop_codon:yes gene_type:complete
VKKIFIFGVGTISDVVFQYFADSGDYKVDGFVEYDELISSSEKFGLPIIKLSQLDKNFPADKYEGFIAIGYKNFNAEREKVYQLLKEKNYKLCSFISKKSVIAKNVIIGENCLILENQTIQPYVQIKNNVYLWSGNHIGHHSIIDENTFVSSHVVISGNCKIGKNCFIGVNSSIADGIEIKNRCTVFMGVSINKNLSYETIAVSKNYEIINSSDRRSKILLNKFYK